MFWPLPPAMGRAINGYHCRASAAPATTTPLMSLSSVLLRVKAAAVGTAAPAATLKFRVTMSPVPIAALGLLMIR